MNLAPLRLAAACLVGAVLLAGCGEADGASAGTASPTPNGIADQPAEAILTTARDLAEQQTSMRLKGKGRCGETPFQADMRLRQDGTGAGTVVLGSHTLQLVGTSDAVYVKGPEAFWTAQADAKTAARIGDRWVKGAHASNPCLTALSSFSNVLENYLGYPGTPVKEPSVGIFGVPAQLLSISPDVSIWIRTVDAPLPVWVSVPSTETTVALGEWGADVAVTVPAADETVDAATLTTR